MLADLSIRRPIFITCIVILMLLVGTMSLFKLGVDLFPDVTFPIVTITTPYPGAAPAEIETQVSKVLEDEVTTLSGIKSVRSTSREGVSIVIAEFSLETDVKYAEQQVRDRVSGARSKLPVDIKEPVIRRIDPGDQAVVMISVKADLPDAKLYDFSKEIVKSRIEQIDHVGSVNVLGGRRREIHVELDRNLMKSKDVAASRVNQSLAEAGKNIPVGKISQAQSETLFRSLGEFRNLQMIANTIVNFFGNEVPVTVKDVGRVVDTLEDETSRVYVAGEKSILLSVFRQSGANTIAVVDAVKAKVAKLNEQFKGHEGNPSLRVVRDRSKFIRINVDDVVESILIGIVLTIIVVFVFLGSVKSTFITALALPNSLLGAFLLMAICGFTINVMTLLALSLAVGLLIDDAIVVRENIFRHQEKGAGPVQAALEGTQEVSLAVIATTLVVISVFGPIAFLQGVVGQFFKQFGLTICFAMAISLFDALTIAPMLSAYLSLSGHQGAHNSPGLIDRLVAPFQRWQEQWEEQYGRLLEKVVRRPGIVLGIALVIFVASLALIKGIPKTFLPAQDSGEFNVSIDLPPGTSLAATDETASKIDQLIRKNKEVEYTVLSIGGTDGEANKADFFVQLVSSKKRNVNTSQFKDVLRGQLKEYAAANPMVKDVDAVGGGLRPFALNIIGPDLHSLEDFALKVQQKLKDHPALKDVDISFRAGKPEFQVAIDEQRAVDLGVSTTTVGMELRTQMEGAVPAVYRENGLEYDVRVRLRDDQRNLRQFFDVTSIPNINRALVPLSKIARPVSTKGASNIDRQDRGRYVQVSADLAPNGPGMGGAINDVNRMFAEGGDLPLPSEMSYRFIGQAENFKELGQSMVIAIILAILLIYLVLASLYESFITPFSIMLVLPLAACGAFYALFITRASLDLFSMIGCVMLLGVATKNSILLVDYIHQKVDEGMDRAKAIVEGGKTRLRPILMTSFALIAGMLPVAIGLNEASKQRTSMGIAVIGGLISSTLLSLVVIPAAYGFIDDFRAWVRRLLGRTSHTPQQKNGAGPKSERQVQV